LSARGLCLVVALVLSACEKPAVAPAGPESRPEPVVVYASYTDEDYLPSLFAAFTAETGIPVTVRHRDERQNVSEVIEKRGSPVADVLLTRSVQGVWLAADEGALLPLQSKKIPGVVPDWLRDPDGYWTATGFAPIYVALTENADHGLDEAISKYEDLGKPEFRSRVCLSSSSLAVNRTLIANLIADHDVRPAEIIVRGWIANLALPVVSGVAFARFGKPGIAARLPVPGYVDLEAVGIGRHARSPDAARRLVEWFIARDTQVAHSAGSGLLPANAAALAEPYKSLNDEGRRNGGVAGLNEVDAVKLAERAAWR
jgi:iron(III) transport system substrate-binding protein